MITSYKSKKTELLRKAVRNKNVEFLCKYHFDTEPTPSQLEIIRAIAYREYKRIVISAYTRHGKSWSVSQGVLLYLWLNKDKKIVLLAPTADQTSILRNYMVSFILKSKEIIQLLDFEADRESRIKREISRTRITFKNGCELKVLSASGTAERLMGWGGDLIVPDESCLIDYDVYRQKISRMMGDSPESMLVEIGNPWNKLNQMWEHWKSDKFKKIHIPYTIGLKEGRVEEEFIEEQRELLSPLEFQILYKAEFPDDSEDTLIKWKWIEKALEKKFKFNNGEIIYGLDVAEAGVDFTVLTKIEVKKGDFKVVDIKDWHKADTMKTVGSVVSIIEKKSKIYVDSIGVGKGVLDRLKERGYKAVGIKVGRKSRVEIDRFSNEKARLYWGLRTLFEDGRISIPRNNTLIVQLNAMRYSITSAGKIKIEDPPKKSPDFADSLMLACSGSLTYKETKIPTADIDSLFPPTQNFPTKLF